MSRTDLLNLLQEFNWLRNHCMKQLEAAEFFENRDLIALNRGAAVAYDEAVSRLQDALARIDQSDYETLCQPLVSG